MSANKIITNIVTDLYKYLSLSQKWFIKTPLRSIIYGISNMIIKTGEILKETILKFSTFKLENNPNIFNQKNQLPLIIHDLFETMSSLKTIDEVVNKVINVSELLKKIIETENKILQENGGDVFYDGNDLTYVLLRDNEQMYYSFPQQLTQILWTNSKMKLRMLNLEGLQDKDSFTYYLQASSYDWPQKIKVIPLSKKEAMFITKRIYEIDDSKI
jgi:hypothetical protein